MSEKDIAVIDRVELRIALAGDGAQFQNAINIYLVPLMSKFSSIYPEVHNKISKICNDLLLRMNSFRSIQVPYEQLIAQMQSSNESKGEGHLLLQLNSILFISKALPNFKRDEFINLISKLISGIAKYNATISARLFRLLCEILHQFGMPDFESQEFFALQSSLRDFCSDEDIETLSSLISKFLLLSPVSNVAVTSLPGLSSSDINLFSKAAGMNLESGIYLSKTKELLIKFAVCTISKDLLAYVLLIGTCDSSQISAMCNQRLKTIDGSIIKKNTIDKFVGLVTGSEDGLVLPAKPVLQNIVIEKLMSYKGHELSDNIMKICRIGMSSDYPKLRVSTAQLIRLYSNWTLRDRSIKVPFHFYTQCLDLVKKCIISEGWPKIESANDINVKNILHQRALFYEIYCALLKDDHDSFTKDFGTIDFLFKSLEYEDVELRYVIQAGLSNLSHFSYQISDEGKEALKKLVKEYFLNQGSALSDGVNACCYVGLKFINSALDFADAETRYICILGTSNYFSGDVQEEAYRGLDPFKFSLEFLRNQSLIKSSNNLKNFEITFPPVNQLLNLYVSELNTIRTLLSRYEVSERFLYFIFQSLVKSSVSGRDSVLVVSENWNSLFENALAFDETVKSCLLKEVEEMSKQETETGSHLGSFISLVLDSFIESITNKNQYNNLTTSTLHYLLSFAPSSVFDSLPIKHEMLLNLLVSDQVPLPYIKDFSQCIGNLFSNRRYVKYMYESTAFNIMKHHGILHYLSSAYFFSRLLLRGNIDLVNEAELISYLESLLDYMEKTSYYELSLDCVFQLSIFGVFGMLESTKGLVIKFLDIIEKRGFSEDKSLTTYASLTLNLSDNEPEMANDELTKYEKTITNTYDTKSYDRIFSAGEAIVLLAAGWQSTLLKKEIDLRDAVLDYLPHKQSRIRALLDFTMNSCLNSKPSLSKAGCIWLLSEVQYCGNLEEVQNRIDSIQKVFMKFLSNGDDFIQDAASRGLGIIYEIGGRELKDDLMRGMMKSLSETDSSKLLSGSVGLDTELFEPGMIKTDEGMVTVYKDVLNLSNRLGDPSLVYKFMALSKSSALWNSKKGIAFSLGTILSKSDLDKLFSSNPSLKKDLVLKLFRYRFDPNKSVATSMNSIWKSVVIDEREALIENFDLLLSSLLKDAQNKEWRMRQSSISAIYDLVQIRAISGYQSRLEEVWLIAFRSMDDIKETVRKEGETLAKYLCNSLINSLKASSSMTVQTSERILSTLIPFLLGPKGVLNEAEEIRVFSIKTLLGICQSSRNVIGKFVPDLLKNFITSMSSMEPEAVNYLLLNSSRYNLDADQIDSQRLMNLGSSPLMRASEELLNHLDASIMPLVVQSIKDAISGSVGLPSKVSGSKILVALASKHFELVVPYSDELLGICIKQLGNRNEIIVVSYATAAGHLCKMCSIPSILKLSANVEKKYFSSEDEKGRILASAVSKSLSKYSGERFSTVLSAFLPLAFIGKHDIEEKAANNFEAVWTEYAIGKTSVQLYSSEIFALIFKNLDTTQISLRQTLLAALCEYIKSVNMSSVLNAESAESLIKLLINFSKKRNKNKGVLFEILVLLTLNLNDSSLDSFDLQDQVTSLLCSEGLKNSISNSLSALENLNLLFEALDSRVYLQRYLDLVRKLISRDSIESDDDEDEDMVPGLHDANAKKNEEFSVAVLAYALKTCISIQDPQFMLDILHLMSEFLSGHSLFIWKSKFDLNNLLSDLALTLESAVFIPKKSIDLVFKLWKQMGAISITSYDVQKVKTSFINFTGSLLNVTIKLNNQVHQEMITILEEYKKDLTSSDLEKLQNSSPKIN